VPGPGDIVFINSNVITLDVTTSVASLTLSGGTLQGASGLAVSDLTIIGGILSGSGPVTVGDQFTWSGGMVLNTGGVTLNGASSLYGAGANAMTLQGLLINAGPLTWSGSGSNLFFNSGATITNLASGTITIAADVSCGATSETSGIIWNAGRVAKTGGTNASVINATFVNPGNGTVEVQTGTLTLIGEFSGGAGTEAGLITIDGGATLNFGGGTHTMVSNFSATGPGTLMVSGGEVDFDNPAGNSVSNLMLVGGTLGGTGLLAVNGQFTWSAGEIQNSGGVTLNNTNYLNGVNAGAMVLGGRLINAGALTWSGIGTNLYFDNSGTINNLTNGTITITTDVSSSSGGITFDNAGMITKTGSNGTTILRTAFVNTGTLNVQSGTIDLAGTYTLNNGTLSFGISGATNYGQINLPGAPSFKASLGVNLNGFYWPPVGTSFNLINYGTRPAALLFTNTALPPFISWQTNYNSNAFTLTVTTRQTNTEPTNLTMSLAGNSNLNLAWPGDHTGWQLEAQTNPLQVGISTNWITVSGSDQTNQVTVPVGLSNGAVFFRLAYP
jgi:hypothetical protein